MADPSITFICGGCGLVEALPIDTLQLVGKQGWLDANGWRARRASPHTTRCNACWTARPLADPDDVEVVRVRPPSSD